MFEASLCNIKKGVYFHRQYVPHNFYSDRKVRNVHTKCR